MLCNIKPVPFHESDKHIFAKIPGGDPDPRSPPLDPPIKPVPILGQRPLQFTHILTREKTLDYASRYSSVGSSARPWPSKIIYSLG